MGTTGQGGRDLGLATAHAYICDHTRVLDVRGGPFVLRAYAQWALTVANFVKAYQNFFLQISPPEVSTNAKS